MKKLNRVGAAALLGALTTSFSGKSSAELKEDGASATMISAVSKTSGVDAESITFSNNDTTNYGDATVLGVSNGDKVFTRATGSGVIDAESFDAIDTTNPAQVRIASMTIVNNQLPSATDGIVSLCHTKQLPSANTGIQLSAAVPYINHGGIINNGVVTGSTKLPLIANLDSNDIFDQSLKPFLPVLRTSGDYVTSGELATETGLVKSTKYNGDTVNTAPFLVGKSIELVKVCSTNAYLSNYGAAVNSDETLSSDAGVEAIIVKMTDGTDTNYLSFDSNGVKNARLVPTTDGSGKDLTASITVVEKLRLSKLISDGILAHSTTASKLVIDNEAAEDLVVEIAFTLTVNTNSDTMILTSSATGIALKSITDATTKKEVTTGARYNAIKTIVEGGSVYALTPDLRLSNTNLADRSMSIDMDIKSYVVPMTTKVPVIYKKSIINLSDTDTVTYLTSAKITNNSALAADVYNTISSFIASMKGRTDDEGYITTAVDGLGANFIKPMVVSKPIDAKSRSTMESTNTAKDVGAYILDTIVSVANTTYSKSNLGKAVDAMLPGEEITLTIAAGSAVADVLSRVSVDGLNSRFKVVVASSSKLGDSAIATFKIGDDVNELTPVILGQSDDYIYQGVEVVAGGSRDITCIVPIRKLYINSPIFMEFNVTNLTEALGRQA